MEVQVSHSQLCLFLSLLLMVWGMWLDRATSTLEHCQIPTCVWLPVRPTHAARSRDPSPPPSKSFPENGASHFLIRLYSVSTGLVMNEIPKCNHNWYYSCPRNVQSKLPANSNRKQWCGWQAALVRLRFGSKLFPCASSRRQKRYLERRNKQAMNSCLLVVCGSLCLLQTGMTC